MLYDKDGITTIDQGMQYFQEFIHIREMQAGSRFVEYIKRPACRAFRQLGRELHPLRLAAGEGRRGLAELDIAQADVV